MSRFNPRNFNKRNYEQKSERKGGGGKFPPWEMETLTFTPGETFYMRVLPPLGGEPYYKHYHWPQGGGPHACTLEHPDFDEKCVGCQTFGPKDRARRVMRTVLDVIDFRYFHVIPHPSREGKETISRCTHDDPNPRRNRCKLCGDSSKSIAERHGPAHKVLEMNQDQWDQIWSAHKKLSGICVYEDKNGDVCDSQCYPVSYVCEGCEGEVISEDQIRDMSDKELARVLSSKYDCDCGRTDYLWDIVACDGEDCGISMSPSEREAYEGMTPKERRKFSPEDAGHWVIQGSMFDATLEVTITGKTKVINGKSVELKGFNFSANPWSLLEDDLAPYDMEDEDAEKLCTAFDLADRYRPERSVKRSDFPEDDKGADMWVDAVLDAQAEGYSVDNPYQGTSGGASGWKQKGGRRSFKRD